MAATIRQERQQGVAVIRLSQPPLNLLGPALRRDLDQALAAAMSDDSVTAILLTGQAAADMAPAQGLSAGLDPAEDAPGAAAPAMAAICRRIDDSPVPVVALLHGQTLGAGAELALAAQARVATGEAALGFPDLALGLCPGAGGSQILTRMLGAGAALDLLLSQHPRPLRSRILRPLVDLLVPEDRDAEAAAVTLAADLAAAVSGGGRLRRSQDHHAGLADFAANAAAIAKARAAASDIPVAAAARIVDCVEAACLLPWSAGLALEAVTFEDCLSSEAFKALRHVALAEARSPRLPALPQATGLAPIRRVGLLGAGTTAAQCAVACLAAGVPVVHLARSAAALSALSDRIATAQASLLRMGRITSEAATAQRALWQGATELADLAQADLLICAMADNLPATAQVMAALDRLAPAGAVLASTSALQDIGRLAGATARPGAVLGVRLTPPAHLTLLAEVIPGPATTAATVARVSRFLQETLARLPVCTGPDGGGIAETIATALREAGAGMLRLGGSPAQIDRALQDYGFAHGLFRQMDITGLEACQTQARIAATRLDAGRHLADDLDRLLLAGRGGQGTGRGYYLWHEARPQPDRAVSAILDLPDPAPSAGEGRTGAQGPLTESAIILRAVAAMANTGARLLRAGLVRHAADIDLLMIHAHGFPRWHGGPMQAAQLVGLFEIAQALKRFTPENPGLYTPDPIFAALAREGLGFDGMTRAESLDGP